METNNFAFEVKVIKSLESTFQMAKGQNIGLSNWLHFIQVNRAFKVCHDNPQYSLNYNFYSTYEVLALTNAAQRKKDELDQSENQRDLLVQISLLSIGSHF